MKLKINGEYVKVGFWSLMKCLIIVDIIFTAMIYAVAFVVGLFFA